MKTEQKVFVAAIVQRADLSFPVNAEILWPGGSGWLDIIGQFTGASAVILANWTPGYAAGTYHGSGCAIPDFSGGITAPGVYKFSAPEGILIFSGTLTGSDTINDLYIKAIRLDSYETGH